MFTRKSAAIFLFGVLGVVLFSSCSKTEKNLGMTFQDFKGYYYAKSCEFHVPYDLYSAKIDENKGIYSCIFDKDVIMIIETDNQTRFIKRIAVSTQPIKSKAKSETVNLVSKQSMIYSLAAMVFSPKMENQIWREGVLEKLLKITDGKEILSDNISCKSIYHNDEMIFIIEPK